MILDAVEDPRLLGHEMLRNELAALLQSYRSLLLSVPKGSRREKVLGAAAAALEAIVEHVDTSLRHDTFAAIASEIIAEHSLENANA